MVNKPLILLFLFFSFSLSQYYGDSVLLDSIRALTFSSKSYTAARRTSAIPQLQCVGGSAQSEYKYYPSVVQCINQGSDGQGNVNWKCEADLDDSVKFGATTVSCEGYSHPDDLYILKGSCGLEYELEFTEKGRRNSYNAGYSSNSYNSYDSYDAGTHYGQSRSSSGGWFMWIVIAAIAYGIYRQFKKNNSQDAPAYNPNSFNPNYNPNNNPNNAYYGASAPPSYDSSTSSSSSSSWRPGFWSGMGLGGILSQMFRPRHQNYYGQTYGQPYYRPQPSYGFRTGSSFGSSGSSSSPSSTRTANAYATTKRR